LKIPIAIFLSFYLSFGIHASAGPSLGDSLTVILLRDTAFKNFAINPAKGLLFGDSALNLSKKINWTKGELISYQAIAANYWALMDYQRAIYYYEQAFALAKSLNDKEQMVHSRIQIGTCYTGMKQFEKALNTYETSLQTARILNSEKHIISCYFSMAHCLINLNRPNEAIQYLEQLLRHPSVVNNPRQKSFVHQNFIDVLTKMNKPRQALEHVDSVYSIGAKLNEKDLLVNATRFRGEIFATLLQYDKAVKKLRDAIGMMGNVDNHADKGKLAILWNMLAGIYKQQWISQKDQSSLLLAKQAYSNAIELALSINEWQILSNAYAGRSDTEQALGHYLHALNDYKYHEAARDSINNLEKENMLRRTELDQEFNKWQDSLRIINTMQEKQLVQQQENSRLQLRQTLYGWIISLLLLGVIAGILLFRKRIQHIRMKHLLSMKEHEAGMKEAALQAQMNDLMLSGIKSQMNPHFLFNCLTSIALYIEERNLEAATRYLSLFSQLIRYTLDAANNVNILLGRELDMLKLYLELESMRFKQKLTYDIETDPELDLELLHIPHMMVQPVVENAIWHGLMHKPEGGHIHIAFKHMDGSLLRVTVEDNGIGRQQSALLKSGKFTLRKSMGTKLLQDRIELMNRSRKLEGVCSFTTADLADAQGNPRGTRVTLIISVA
jgi:tetratricopeptide (TPR) repeat protein